MNRGLQERDDVKKYELTKSAQILIILIGFLVTAFPIGGLITLNLYRFVLRDDIMKEILISNNKLLFSAWLGGTAGLVLGVFSSIAFLWIITSIRQWRRSRKLRLVGKEE